MSLKLIRITQTPSLIEFLRLRLKPSPLTIRPYQFRYRDLQNCPGLSGPRMQGFRIVQKPQNLWDWLRHFVDKHICPVNSIPTIAMINYYGTVVYINPTGYSKLILRLVQDYVDMVNGGTVNVFYNETA